MPGKVIRFVMGFAAATSEPLHLLLRHHSEHKLVVSGNVNTNIPNFSSIITKNNTSSRSRRKLSVVEAYKRIPMDAALGAYRLLDKRTGDKLIVLGGSGTNTDDPPQGVGVSASPVAVVKVKGAFDRLKATKIKQLIKSSSSSTSKVATTDKNPKQQYQINVVEEEEQVAAPEYVPPTPTKSRSAVTSTTLLRGWSRATPVHHNNAQYPRHRHKMVDTGFFSRHSFKHLGCTDDITESLRTLSFTRPSHIQALAFAPLLQGKSCIVADQSGSGKTLAYLIPIIQRLRQEELQGLSKHSSNSPRVVILVPTAELASQVLNNCRSISKHGVPFRSMVVTGGFRQKTQLESLQQDLDVLIATPGRFIYLLQEGFVQLTNLKCIVLDEVDILFGDEGFKQVLQSLINSAAMQAQYVFVTATLPVDTYNKLVQVFPDCKVIMGPGIHRTSSGLEEVLVDCSGDVAQKNPETAFLNKKSALLKLAEEHPVPKTIVFCNKIETCRMVENALKRFDRQGLQIKVLPFHAALAQDTRLANIKEFLNSNSNNSMVLVCTDRASRGIDFQNVDHVVLFDFPRDPSEYVRRVGRTARGAGGNGKAFVFVVGKQVSLARRIMERNVKGHPLHDVPSAYELESSVM